MRRGTGQSRCEDEVVSYCERDGVQGSHAPDDLGGGCDLNDVTTLEEGKSAQGEALYMRGTHKNVGVNVGLDDCLPLARKTELLRLEPERESSSSASVLASQKAEPRTSSWCTVLRASRGRRHQSRSCWGTCVSRKTARLKRKDSPLDVGVKAAVERANGRPVEVEGLDVLVRDTSSEVGLLESRADGTHRRLRSHTRHACAPSSVAAGVEGGMNALSMATSTTSAPAAAQASMLAVEIPAVSWE